MNKRKPLCCVINYETKDNVDTVDWKVVMLAYSLDDALKYLRKRVPKLTRINSQEASREVDVFHPSVIKDYLTEEVVEEVEVEVPVEVQVEIPIEVIKEVPIKGNFCPWCEKQFKTSSTLKSHCIKYHLKDE